MLDERRVHFSGMACTIIRESVPTLSAVEEEIEMTRAKDKRLAGFF